LPTGVAKGEKCVACDVYVLVSVNVISIKLQVISTDTIRIGFRLIKTVVQLTDTLYKSLRESKFVVFFWLAVEKSVITSIHPVKRKITPS